MKLAFYQAAMLTVAVQATEAATQEEAEASYFPDLLVQTASIVDYFYPFVHESEHITATALAQTKNPPEPTFQGQVESEIESGVDLEVDADADADADVELDAELDAAIDAEIESEVYG